MILALCHFDFYDSVNPYFSRGRCFFQEPGIHRVIIFNKILPGSEYGTNEANELIGNVVQNESRRFSFGHFAQEIFFKRGTVGSERHGG